MIVFPNCKINLGLNVVSKRTDGFHELQTVFYPVNWCDALEIIVNTEQNAPEFTFTSSGLEISNEPQNNIVWKAWRKISQIRSLPPLKVHLHKNIPMGAGLGGGSADAAFFIKQINQVLHLEFSEIEQIQLAAELGSDCAFFIQNKLSYATGRGELLSPIALNLDVYYLLLIHPNIHCNTKVAFAGLQPKPAAINIKDVLQKPISEWKDFLFNDFETTIFKAHPAIAQLKQVLYLNGALYASMSGSGSTVYGIFEQKPDLSIAEKYSYYLQNPASKIL